MTMTPEFFQQIGEALYGAEWRLPLSRALGVNYKTIRRWRTGDQLVPAGVAVELRRLLVYELESRKQLLAEVEAALAAAGEKEVSDG